MTPAAPYAPDRMPEDETASQGDADYKAERRRARAALARRMMHRLNEVDPELAAKLTAAGFVPPDPTGDEFPITTPMEVVQRFLERSVERHPSMLGQLGLTAIQMLSEAGDDSIGPGTATPLTVVFTDIEGFTSYTEAEGDDAASALVNRHHQRVGPIIRGRGGRVTKRMGDGMLITFPEPEAAVLCALEMVNTTPDPLRLRAGMHAGDVVVTRDDVLGHVVNVAARVTEAAGGGEVLVTSAVRDAADELPGIDWGPLEERPFRGLAEPVKVCTVRRRD